MKKIIFKVDQNEWMLFLEEVHIKEICSHSGSIEKGGYIFVSKIKGVRELKLELLTKPHPKDFGNETFMSLSKEHKKIAKKIRKKDRHLYEIGFYHTHPEFYGAKPSYYDLDVFRKISKKHEFSVFIIGVEKYINIYIYHRGENIKEEKIWIQQN